MDPFFSLRFSFERSKKKKTNSRTQNPSEMEKGLGEKRKARKENKSNHTEGEQEGGFLIKGLLSLVSSPAFLFKAFFFAICI